MTAIRSDKRRSHFLSGAAIVASLWLAPAMAQTAGENDGPKGVTVTTVKAVKNCFTATVEVFGILLPVEEMSVSPNREGLKIQQVLTDPGATVVAGQALVRLQQPEGGEITLVSPVAGTVSAVNAVVGSIASMRATDPLVRVIARSEFELVGEVSARDMAKLSPGQTARIKVIGAPNVSGRVRSISSTIDPITQLGQVRVQVTAQRPRLLVNSSGRATITTGESCNVAVPLTAVLYGSSGAVIQVVRARRIETRRVEIGLMSAGQVEIKEGVREGDIVVARAGALLREGDPVQVVAVDDVGKK